MCDAPLKISSGRYSSIARRLWDCLWDGFRSLHKAMKKATISSLINVMPRLSREQRLRAIGMVQAGLSYSDVSRRMGCSQPTIRRLVERHEETGSVDDRQRPGRERVTSPDQDRYIRLQHLRDRFRTASRTARETPGRHNPRVSSPTVRRRLREYNLHARRPFRGTVLTPRHRQTRLQWCQQRRRWNHQRWNSVLFTDESRFCVDAADGRERVWRRNGERYAQCCICNFNRWGGPSMVWAGMSHNYRTPLVVIDGTLTARRYIDEVLQPQVLPFLQQHQDLALFQQDNARPHSARLTTDFLQTHNVEVLPWPPYSPDLNPIEHLWDELGRRVSNRIPRPENRQQLIRVLQEEWDAIPQDRIRRLVRSVRQRVASCLAANGGHTPY